MHLFPDNEETLEYGHILQKYVETDVMNISDLESKTHELYDKMSNAQYEYAGLWLQYQLFTWRWWITVSLLVLPWTFWLIVRKRKSTHRLLSAYLLVALFSVLADFAGAHHGLWYYPVTLVPLMPCYIVFDLSVLPVTTMLFIQFFPKVRAFYIALIYAALGSFIFQPAMEALGLVVHERWTVFSTFPVLFLLYLVSHRLAVNGRFEAVV